MVEKPLYGRRTKSDLLADGVGQRRHGEGSLFQTSVRGEKVWRASRVVKTPDGTRRKVSGTGATPALATERLALNLEQYRQQIGSGQISTPKRKTKTTSSSTPTFAGVAVEWLEWRRRYSLPDTHKQPLDTQAANQYRLMIKNHLTIWGANPITDYTTDVIRDFTYYKIQEKNLSNSHLRGIQGVVYQVFAFAFSRNYLTDDPARNLVMSPRNKKTRISKVKGENLEKLAYVPDRIMTYLVQGRSEEEFQTNGVLDERRYNTYKRLSVYEARWAMSALLALRPAEVLGLTWDRLTYLNLKNRDQNQIAQVAIVQQLARDPDQEGLGTKLYLKQTVKTKAGERVLPLSDELVEMLRRWQTTQKEWKKAPDWQPYTHLSNLVFTTKTGKPIRQQDDNATWRELLANVFRATDSTSEHIRSLRLYALRHLAITRMLRSGVQLTIVSEIAGHSSVSLTHDVYGHLDITDRVRPLLDLSDRTLKERTRNLARQNNIEQEPPAT